MVLCFSFYRWIGRGENIMWRHAQGLWLLPCDTISRGFKNAYTNGNRATRKQFPSCCIYVRVMENYWFSWSQSKGWTPQINLCNPTYHDVPQTESRHTCCTVVTTGNRWHQELPKNNVAAYSWLPHLKGKYAFYYPYYSRSFFFLVLTLPRIEDKTRHYLHVTSWSQLIDYSWLQLIDYAKS